MDCYTHGMGVAISLVNTRRTRDKIQVSEERLGFEDYKPYSPTKVGGRRHDYCMSLDKMRGGRTAMMMIAYPAKLGFTSFCNNKPWEAIIWWNDYEG